MAVRLYVIFAMLATLAFLLYAGHRAGFIGKTSRPMVAAVRNPVPQAAVRPASLKPAPAKPAPAWLAARDQALDAYLAQRYQDALEACGRAIALAATAGRAQQALALVTCGGFTEMQPSAPVQTEDWLQQAAAISQQLNQDAIAAALGPQEAMLKERCLRALGMYYRDRGRPGAAAENLALAVDTVRAMPPPETADQRMALRSDLFDLGVALAKLGYRGTARKAFAESREYYLKTEPDSPALKAIEEQERRLSAPQGN